MRTTVTIFICTLLAIHHPLFAQEKKALLIGINNYQPPARMQPVDASLPDRHIPNLRGAVNDVKAIRSILVSKYGFRNQSVVSLVNEDANRANIMMALHHLLSSKKGDVVFIYYAGHGSQVFNSLSKENDKMDETLVPADTWKKGVHDIRDKELAVLFDSLLSKGVILTVVFDCCHSGSASRQPFYPGAVKRRYAESENYDAKDSSDIPPPEKINSGSFLFISASQEDEAAEEQVSNSGTIQGAFTLAFITAVFQNAYSPVIQLFSSSRAILKSNSRAQEPAMVASVKRQSETLTGLPPDYMSGKTEVPVMKITNRKVFLQGGSAIGLYAGSELMRIKGKDTIRLLVDSLPGIDQAQASLLQGKISDIKAGDNYEVQNWVVPAASVIHVFLPRYDASFSDMQKAAQRTKTLRDDYPSLYIPDWEKKASYAYILSMANGCINTNLAGPDTKYDSGKLEPYPATPATSYTINIAYDSALSDIISQRLMNNHLVNVVSNPALADYVLYGTIDSAGLPSFGLRLPYMPAPFDSLPAMPAGTSEIALADNRRESYETVAGFISTKLNKLAKVKAWQQLAPPFQPAGFFPFSMRFINQKHIAVASGRYRIGDTIDFHLALNDYWTDSSLTPKYVYVFIISNNGEMKLFYPRSEEGNVNNQYPKRDSADRLISDNHLFRYKVTEPTGTDHFFVLAAEHPIPDYAFAFNQEGVRAAHKLQKKSVQNILYLGNENSRSDAIITDEKWTLLRQDMITSY